MDVYKIISKIRVLAFSLFFVTSIGLIGSLLIHNYIVKFEYTHSVKYSDFMVDQPGNKFSILCDQSNGFCNDIQDEIYKKNKKLDMCFKYAVEKNYYVDDKLINNDDLIYTRRGIKSQSEFESKIKGLYSNQTINLEFIVVDIINKKCIKNSSYVTIYKIFPKLFDYLANFKSKGLKLASSVSVNPFIYGEVSISNLVKRPPINYFFKTLLYVSIVLMVVYWINFNRVFKNIFNQKKNIFFILGVLSAFFLFFHILFLGSTIENELFKKARRLIIVLFILFELLAQIFLAKQLFNKRDLLIKYCHKSIILVKITFVSIIVLVSFVIILILAFANLPSNIDYILEWNYFLILLIFYFLSSIMWKSKI